MNKIYKSYKPILNTVWGHAEANTAPPIWIMRQAGRYLPQYKEVRSKFKHFMDFCLSPYAAAEVTLQPIECFGMDAAIIFSDILVVPKAMGMKVEFVEGIGPKLAAISRADEVGNYATYDVSVFAKVAEAIRLVRAELETRFPKTALIGFAGGPFTVAAYMLEGGGSKDFAKTLQFALQHRAAFMQLIDQLVEVTIIYLKLQIEAGVEIIKLFDSWAGLVPYYLFDAFVLDPIQRIVSAIKQEFPEVPCIVFMRGAGSRMRLPVGAECVAVDQYTDLSWCMNHLRASTTGRIVLQGNLDNALLAYGDKDLIRQEVKKILRNVTMGDFIFNLGHGILPNTPVENVHYLMEVVKNECNKTG
jgi:uroporphyrinogen decarboxylase